MSCMYTVSTMQWCNVCAGLCLHNIDNKCAALIIYQPQFVLTRCGLHFSNCPLSDEKLHLSALYLCILSVMCVGFCKWIQELQTAVALHVSLLASTGIASFLDFLPSCSHMLYAGYNFSSVRLFQLDYSGNMRRQLLEAFLWIDANSLRFHCLPEVHST